jgi:hypothetical protein
MEEGEEGSEIPPEVMIQVADDKRRFRRATREQLWTLKS